MWIGSELVADIALALNTLSALQPDLLSSIIKNCPRELANCPIVHAPKELSAALERGAYPAGCNGKV